MQAKTQKAEPARAKHTVPRTGYAVRMTDVRNAAAKKTADRAVLSRSLGAEGGAAPPVNTKCASSRPVAARAAAAEPETLVKAIVGERYVTTGTADPQTLRHLLVQWDTTEKAESWEPVGVVEDNAALDKWEKTSLPRFPADAWPDPRSRRNDVMAVIATGEGNADLVASSIKQARFVSLLSGEETSPITSADEITGPVAEEIILVATGEDGPRREAARALLPAIGCDRRAFHLDRAGRASATWTGDAPKEVVAGAPPSRLLPVGTAAWCDGLELDCGRPGLNEDATRADRLRALVQAACPTLELADPAFTFAPATAGNTGKSSWNVLIELPPAQAEYLIAQNVMLARVYVYLGAAAAEVVLNRPCAEADPRVRRKRELRMLGRFVCYPGGSGPQTRFNWTVAPSDGVNARYTYVADLDKEGSAARAIARRLAWAGRKSDDGGRAVQAPKRPREIA